ncbi:extracellular solute-binding protein [Candidatus Aerophobetes bacterium]|uniref:Extracellular solute-binding protein n=1 Tax=Aerophobetes bacterium TaxID=2030807 RepID=A0A523W273_UNCAE|nr:MAG: extracellular solute-binding protein [Candidatus Aerophobetes bacterium]
MRRSLLNVTIAAMMVAIVSCFSVLPVVGSTFPSAEEAKIDWGQFKGETITMLFNRHPWQESIEPLIPDFEKLTGMSVKVTVLPEKEFMTKVPADLTAGTFAFDVFMTQYYDAPQYDLERWTAPLGKYILDPELTDLAWYNWLDFFPAAQKIATAGGTYEDRVAITAEVESIIYRKDVLEGAGLTVPDTFEELLQAAEKIGQQTGKSGVVLRGHTTLWWPLYGVVKSYGGDYFTSQYEPVVNSPEMVAGVEMWNNLMKNGPPGITGFDWEEIVTATVAGQTSMFLDSSGLFSSLLQRGLSPDKAGIAPFPKGPAGRIPHAHMWSISISSASKKKAAAWLFIQWATSQEVQFKQALSGGTLTPRTSALDNPEVIVKNPELTYTVSQGLKAAVLSRPHLKFWELMDPLARILQQVLLGEKEVEPALNEVQKEWERIF